MHPDGFLKRLVGARRVSTVRGRVRGWRKIRDWMCDAPQVVWPSSIHQFLGYMEMRVAEPCGRGVPETMLATLSFFEKVGAVALQDRISTHPVVKTAVEPMTAQLWTAAPGAPHKAPRPSVVMILVLETMVCCEDIPSFGRVFAWYFSISPR